MGWDIIARPKPNPSTTLAANRKDRNLQQPFAKKKKTARTNSKNVLTVCKLCSLKLNLNESLFQRNVRDEYSSDQSFTSKDSPLPKQPTTD
jgi:hypothetical protein